jgi:hypothetical protein
MQVVRLMKARPRGPAKLGRLIERAKEGSQRGGRKTFVGSGQ